MDTAMRDMEQMREREDEVPGRRFGTWVLAGVAIAGLAFALGVLLDGESSTADDAAAERANFDLEAESLSMESRAGAEDSVREAEAGEETAPNVDRERLVFPTALVEEDERPEVAAALAAAAAEHAHPDPEAAEAAAPSPAMAGGPHELGEQADGPNLIAQLQREQAEAGLRALPAAVAANPSSRMLTQTAKADPMMGAALPKREPTRRAPRGMDGEYTLQVISYRTASEAAAFAEALRDKGHEAFVIVADVPGRGVHHRVRVGPFESLREAESYRAAFEREERMNTFVVRRLD